MADHREEGQQEQRPGVRRASVPRSHQEAGAGVSNRAERASKEFEVGL